MDELEQKVSSLENSLRDLTNDLETKKFRISELESQEKENADIIQNYDKISKDTTSRVHSLEQKNESLVEALQDAKYQIDNLKQESREFQDVVSKLTKASEEQVQIIEKMTSEKEKLESNFRTVSEDSMRDLENLNRQVKDLNKNNEENEAKISHLNAENMNFQSKFENLQQEKDDVINRLQSEVASRKVEYEENQRLIKSEFESLISNLQVEKQDAIIHGEKLLNELNTSRNLVSEQSSRLESLQSKNDDFSQRIEALVDQKYQIEQKMAKNQQDFNNEMENFKHVLSEKDSQIDLEIQAKRQMENTVLEQSRVITSQNDMIQELKTQMENFRDYDDVKQEVKQVLEKLNQAESGINQLNVERQDFKQTIDSLQESNQQSLMAQKKEFEDKITQLENEKEKLADDKYFLEAEGRTLQVRIERGLDQYLTLEKDFNNLTSEVNKRDEAIVDLKKQLESVQSLNSRLEEATQKNLDLTSEFKEKRQDMEALRASVVESKIEMDKSRQELQDLKEIHFESETRRKDLEEMIENNKKERIALDETIQGLRDQLNREMEQILSREKECKEKLDRVENIDEIENELRESKLRVDVQNKEIIKLSSDRERLMKTVDLVQVERQELLQRQQFEIQEMDNRIADQNKKFSRLATLNVALVGGYLILKSRM